MMMVFYFTGGAFIVTAMAVNVLSGMFLLRRRHRVFSLVIAGFNCMWFPFGTALGVFTFIVLLRESVTRLYTEGITSASR